LSVRSRLLSILEAWRDYSKVDDMHDPPTSRGDCDNV
jgi:hypothetical protein